MQKTAKLFRSPFHDPFEVVGGMVLMLADFGSDKEISVTIDPNVAGYHANLDKPGVQVRQVVATAPSRRAQRLLFDFGKNNVQTVKVDGRSYEIRLMQIGTEKQEGHDFRFFEFLVTSED
jgi:hypothetical protein